MKKFRLPLLASVALICGTAVAQPSGGFYWFKDKNSGQTACAQGAFSPDWLRQAGGPFLGPDCKTAQKIEPAATRAKLPANPLDLMPKK